MGIINWFAVHPTSMNNTNHLISGDNKGLASQLLEKDVNPKDQLSGQVLITALHTQWGQRQKKWNFNEKYQNLYDCARWTLL